MARVSVLPALSLVGLPLLAACDGELLPADYAGPPAAIVKGNATVDPAHATSGDDSVNPSMVMEWLAVDAEALVQQPVTFKRSINLLSDWEISLAVPDARVRLPDAGVNLAVGKVVYYDDRNRDQKVDWECAVAPCDKVHSVSTQFVVYLSDKIYCDAPEMGMLSKGRVERVRLDAGYHYFQFDGTTLHDVPAGLSFPLEQHPESPATTLPSFREALKALIAQGPC